MRTATWLADQAGAFLLYWMCLGTVIQRLFPRWCERMLREARR